MPACVVGVFTTWVSLWYCINLTRVDLDFVDCSMSMLKSPTMKSLQLGSSVVVVFSIRSSNYLMGAPNMR